MSDESTIVATTFLSSLLGATATAPSQSDNALSFLGDLSQNEGGADSFSALFSSNLDALQGSDTSIAPPALSTAAHNQLPSASTAADILNPVARQFSGLAGKLTSLGGGGLPPGDTPQAAPLPGWSELQTTASPELAPPLSELSVTATEQINQSSQNLQHQNFATVENSGDVDGSAVYDPLADPEVSELTPPDVSSQLPVASSPASATAVPQAGQAKLSENSAQQSNLSVQSSALDSASTNDMDTGSDSQPEGQAQNQPEAVELEVRPRQPAAAEFANSLQGQQSSSFQPDGIPPTTAELGSSLPSAITSHQSTASPPLPAQTSLSLGSDRAVAGQQIAQQVATFVRQGSDSAQINLSPPHLGRISVSINLQNEQASVVLTAPTAEIRDLLEASLPKLSELLEDAGLELGNADVSSEQQQLGGQESSADPQGTTSQANHGDSAGSELAQKIGVPATGANLLDAYA